MKNLAIDYAACIGCETCEYICRFLHGTPKIHMTRLSNGVMAPLYCRHCADPNCARVCKKGAIVKQEDGVVRHDPMACRGCANPTCVVACPYAAMFLTDKGVKVAKCDLCAGRAKEGLGPACLAMCPCGAISVAADGERLESQESKAALERVLAHIRPSTK